MATQLLAAFPQETKNAEKMVRNMLVMAEIRKKIVTFRDIIDLPSCDATCPIIQLVMATVDDLHKLYPNIVLCRLDSETEETPLNEALCYLCGALKSINDLWMKNHRWIADSGNEIVVNVESLNSEQPSQRALTRLDHSTSIGKKIFEVVEEDDNDMSSQCYSNKKITCPSPDTPTAFSMEFGDFVYSSPLLASLRLQAMQKLCPVEMKLFKFSHPPDSDKLTKDPRSASLAMSEAKETAIVPNPPPPPVHPCPIALLPSPPPLALSSKGLVPIPPIPTPLVRGAAPPPPPPPVGATRVLRPKKSTKLKRSSHMGNLYRLLKGKVEGSSLNSISTRGKKIGGSSGSKQGMADALAEMTKRSTYFQQIEEDVRKHAKSIIEIQAFISSFQTKDMSELLKFQKSIEEQLEKLTDETQVLARFEGFPSKKLEMLRLAATLYSKLQEIANNLENWKVTLPLGKHLEKIESYFNKIKGEIDTIERSKDEDSKRFHSNSINFDYNILVRIKEMMVDVSSNCMELALKERRERHTSDGARKKEEKACTTTLWKAFQLAFRVYTFAGGQDDRADMLTREVAHEIETDP